MQRGQVAQQHSLEMTYTDMKLQVKKHVHY